MTTATGRARRRRSVWWRERWLVSWLAAALVVVAVFPDLVFGGASIRNSRVLQIFEPRPEASAWLPEPAERKVWHGYRDLGAAAWQLEPAQRFLHRAWTTGEGIDWNPWSAAGTHGPERLASAQLSVITVATALLGAGTGALHAVLLLVFWIAVYCLFRTLREHWRRSLMASLAACFAFLLTGFHTSMLGAQMVHAYLLAPILLFALLRHAERPTAVRFALGTAAAVAMLLETFLPTTILALLAVHSLCLVTWRDRPSAVAVGYRAVRQVLPILVAFLLLLPLWLPILASVPLAAWGDYDARTFEVASPVAALSLLAPEHFWRSYGGFRASVEVDYQVLPLTMIEGTRIFHLGVLATFLALQALGGAGAGRRGSSRGAADGELRQQPVVWAAALLAVCGLARVFGLFPLTLTEHAPVFGKISHQYWSLLIALPSVVLLAFGIDRISANTVRRIPTLAFFAIVGLWFAFLYGRLGWPRDVMLAAGLRWLLVFAACALAAVVVLRWRPRWRSGVALLLALLAVGELLAAMNTLRPQRSALDPASIPYVAHVAEALRPGERVLNVGGRGIYPNWGSAFGIPQIDSLDGVNLGWYRAFFDRRFGKTEHFLAIRVTRVESVVEDHRFDLDALALLGGRFAVVQHQMEAYRTFFERHGWRAAFGAQGVTVYESPTAPGERVFLASLIEAPGLPSDWALDNRRQATTTDRVLLAAARTAGVDLEPRRRPQTPGSARLVVDRAERLVIETRAARPAVLVIADTWHPGWRVTVDGEPAHLGRVDEVLRGVVVPAGYHRVELAYTPRGRNAGLAIAGLTVLVLLGLALLRRRPQSM
ncbi:MAG: hypothetical protein AAGC60_24080 [Acidobacteriota bacterium]